MANRLRVMRKRRGRSLQTKIIDYAKLFNLDVALIARDKTTGEYEVFQPKLDDTFPPARESIDPQILHVGQEVKIKTSKSNPERNNQTELNNQFQLEMQNLEKMISKLEAPKLSVSLSSKT